jgi:ABC-type transport system involved in cytochrome c biogenesis ATPase subunit/GNAT superfamily N-acetyltransferase
MLAHGKSRHCARGGLHSSLRLNVRRPFRAVGKAVGTTTPELCLRPSLSEDRSLPAMGRRTRPSRKDLVLSRLGRYHVGNKQNLGAVTRTCCLPASATSTSMPLFAVESTSSKKHQKLVTVRGEAGGLSTISLPRFALVGPGDRLRMRSPTTARIVDLEGDGPKKWIPVLPTYASGGNVQLSGNSYDLEFREVESAEDQESYEHLESFHYRGRSTDVEPGDDKSGPKGVGGRKAVVLAVLRAGTRTRVVGYIELQMPLMMCKPRHDLLSQPFHHPSANVGWSTWLGDGQRHVNRIVRIARVVVDPEFRGLGISAQLVEHAKSYASTRWHVGGRRPLFIEISAEMLRYVDFVTRCGLPHVGDTEGNLERIFKDLRSIERGATGKSQIMSLQRRYHAAFGAYCEQTGRSFDEARVILSELIAKHDPRSAMPSDEWLAFRPLLRFPIPYHLAGLDSPSINYIGECLSQLRNAKSNSVVAGDQEFTTEQPVVHERRKSQLRLRELEVWVDHELSLSAFVRLAMDSFGIESARLRTRLFGPFDIELAAGNILLVTGSSGAGKSILLDAICGKTGQGLVLRGRIERGGKRAAELHPLPQDVPLLQYFGERYGAERAFDVLCRVGLSEAMVFIKPFSMLSMGQRYRAMLADLLLSGADIWVIDEFCSNLDPVTASVISNQIRRLAKRHGISLIVAAANVSHFIHDLAPERILVVRTGGETLLMNLREFQDGQHEKGI